MPKMVGGRRRRRWEQAMRKDCQVGIHVEDRYSVNTVFGGRGCWKWLEGGDEE
jgi:hypothetical protein